VISALIDKNALAVDTIITATYNSRDIWGRQFSKTGIFKLKNVVKNTNNLVFELKSVDSSVANITTNADSIRAIDGMDIARYADIYGILPDGSHKRVGRKRGRKSKTQLTI